MGILIRNSFLPFTDPEASLAFYRDHLGFEVRMDVGWGEMRWITIGSTDQPDTAIVLQPAVVDPGVTDAERRAIEEMMAKGTFAGIVLATEDLDGLFDRLQAAGAEVIQEPIDQDYGVRDAAVRDPAGNMVRLQQIPKS
ncbi:MAG: VOC family protein [Acidimicrobiia bacterium]